MITAIAHGADDTTVVVLGLTAENLRRLAAGEPIHVSAETHPHFPAGLSIAILVGEDEAALMQQLAPMTGPDTIVRHQQGPRS